MDPISIGQVGGAVTGIAGSLLGSFGGSRKQWIAPGLSSTRAHDESMAAHHRYRDALQRYLDAMTVLGTGARQTGRDMTSMFQSGASGIRGQGARATREVQDIYRDFGRDSEAVARTEYEKMLANIEDSLAVKRARGGNTSAAQMVAGGQRRQAMDGLAGTLAGISSQRAQLLGNATEMGRSREISNEMALLGQGLGVRENQFSLPASFAKTRLDQRFNAETADPLLYPERSLQLRYGGGPTPLPRANPLEEIGATLSNLGGQWFANSKPKSELEKAMEQYIKGQTLSQPVNTGLNQHLNQQGFQSALSMLNF